MLYIYDGAATNCGLEVHVGRIPNDFTQKLLQGVRHIDGPLAIQADGDELVRFCSGIPKDEGSDQVQIFVRANKVSLIVERIIKAIE